MRRKNDNLVSDRCRSCGAEHALIRALTTPGERAARQTACKLTPAEAQQLKILLLIRELEKCGYYIVPAEKT
jgi:hypothetical protein